MLFQKGRLQELKRVDLAEMVEDLQVAEQDRLKASINQSHPLPSTTQKCGASSFLRAARVRAARENDLAATIKNANHGHFVL